MNKRQIERYFMLLSREYAGACRVILTGAAAAALYGRVRPTIDIDFEAKAANWLAFSEAVKKVSERTGIAAQYGEDIDHWALITLGEYAKHTRLYKKFGAIEVRLMEPPYWAIGKLSRYLDTDIQDLTRVFKKTRTSWADAATVAGRCLYNSPRSTACFQFRRQVEHFFRKKGRGVWGRAFDPEQAVQIFHANARIKERKETPPDSPR